MCGLQRYHYRDHCLYRYPCFPSELSDKSDFRRQFVTQFIPYPLLSERDKFANIARCSTAQIHHDIRVNVGDLGTADAKPFHAKLVDQTARAHSLDLSEDRAGRRMKLQPWMPGTAPAQILLNDPVHVGRVARG